MTFVLIALAFAFGLYGVTMALNLVAFVVRGIGVSFSHLWWKIIAASIGVGLAFWFAALAGFSV